MNFFEKIMSKFNTNSESKETEVTATVVDVKDVPKVQNPTFVLTSEEANIIEMMRSNNNDKFLKKKMPLFGMLDTVLRAFIPKNYGTYTTALLLLIISILSMAGIEIPFAQIPQEYSGTTGITAIALWFLRDAIK